MRYALPVGPRNLGAISHVSSTISLDNRREFVVHIRILAENNSFSF